MIAFLLSTLAFAVPVQMNHQGRLLDSSGVGLEGGHLMTFKVYDSETGGSVLWSNAMAVDFSNGYYSINIGEDGNLDSDVLGQYPVYLEITVGTNSPMSPRYMVSSVPYSVISEVAESVEGPVNATEISVNGTVVVDADGNWVGPGGTGSSTGGSTGGSSTGGSTGGTNSPVYWSDILGRPLGLDDGDDFLTEGQVETYISNGFINLDSSARVGGYEILTTASTITPQWSNLQGIPSDIADGDQDTQLSESQVENYIINGAVNLSSGSQAGGSTILTQGDSIPWSSLSNVPVGLDDGDDDTLGGLNCGSGDVVSWNGTAFECLTLSSGAGNGSILDLGSGSTINGSPIVTQSDLSNPNWNDIADVPAGFLDGVDDDSFADISCGLGETISFDGTDWVCVSSTIDFADIANVPADLVDGDNDTLGVLQCTEGQVPVYSEADSGWVCGEGGGASGELAKSNRIGESDGGEAYSNLDTGTPVTVPDDNFSGFTSALYISDSHTISTLSIDLDITHPDMSELTVILTAPSGTAITLLDGDFSGQTDFDGNLGWDNPINGGDLYSYYGEDTVGTWTLQLIDGVSGNTGELNGWTVRFNEDWDGDIFVGDNVTVQEKIETRGELKVAFGGTFVMTNTDGDETLRIDGETGKFTIGGNSSGTIIYNEAFISQAIWVTSEEITITPSSSSSWQYGDTVYAICPNNYIRIKGYCEQSGGTNHAHFNTDGSYGEGQQCRGVSRFSETMTYQAKTFCMSTAP